LSNHTEYDGTFLKSDELLDEVSSVQLLDERIALEPHNFLSEVSMKLIRQIYAEDFSYFRYDTD
jgi:hypothetical protein